LSRALSIRWTIVLAPLATGCALLLGLDEPSFEKTDPGSVDGGRTDGGDGAAPTCAPDLDLTTSADNCGRCGRSCRGKACRDSMCEAQSLAQGNGAVEYIAVDETSIYFSSRDQWILGRLDKNGGAVTNMLPEGGALKEPTAGLLVDEGYVYASAYTSGSGPAARRVPLDGGVIEKIDGCNTGWSLSVDKTDIYWLTGNCGGDARMRRRTKNDPDASFVTSQTDPLAFYSFAQFGYQALDETNVYWANKEQIKALSKNDIEDAAPRTVFARAAGSNDRFRSLAVADRFYAMLGGRIIALPKAGGDPVVLADGFPVKDSHAGLALADADVYFTVPDTGLVARVPMQGGKVETLAKDQQKPTGLALDAQYVYWSNAGDGTLWRTPR
jgi:hypothetical protein